MISLEKITRVGINISQQIARPYHYKHTLVLETLERDFMLHCRSNDI